MHDVEIQQQQQDAEHEDHQVEQPKPDSEEHQQDTEHQDKPVSHQLEQPNPGGEDGNISASNPSGDGKDFEDMDISQEHENVTVSTKSDILQGTVHETSADSSENRTKETTGTIYM